MTKEQIMELSKEVFETACDMQEKPEKAIKMIANAIRCAIEDSEVDTKADEAKHADQKAEAQSSGISVNAAPGANVQITVATSDSIAPAPVEEAAPAPESEVKAESKVNTVDTSTVVLADAAYKKWPQKIALAIYRPGNKAGITGVGYAIDNSGSTVVGKLPWSDDFSGEGANLRILEQVAKDSKVALKRFLITEKTKGGVYSCKPKDSLMYNLYVKAMLAAKGSASADDDDDEEEAPKNNRQQSLDDEEEDE